MFAPEQFDRRLRDGCPLGLGWSDRYGVGGGVNVREFYPMVAMDGIGSVGICAPHDDFAGGTYSLDDDDCGGVHTGMQFALFLATPW